MPFFYALPALGQIVSYKDRTNSNSKIKNVLPAAQIIDPLTPSTIAGHRSVTFSIFVTFRMKSVYLRFLHFVNGLNLTSEIIQGEVSNKVWDKYFY